MNFYASPGYLKVVADVYFAGKTARVGDVSIAGEILRVLIVGRGQAVTDVPFLDYHLPLRADEVGFVERRASFAPRVARGTVSHDERHAAVHEGLETAPYVDWSLFVSYDDYLAFLKARHTGTIRKLQRLRRRLVESLGPLEFAVNDRREDVVTLAIRWKSRQLRDKGLDDIFTDPRNVRFFGVLRERGLLVASSLRASGRLLAVWLGFIHDDVWSGWIFTYDPEPQLSRYSAGHQLLQSMLAHSYRSGHREFDHSVGDHDYKWLYATNARLIGPLLQEWSLAAARAKARKILNRSGLISAVRKAERLARGS
jgi:CelD/BcsL family acetyltransferase involved in cellulose biosynthesis